MIEELLAIEFGISRYAEIAITCWDGRQIPIYNESSMLMPVSIASFIAKKNSAVALT